MMRFDMEVGAGFVLGVSLTIAALLVLDLLC
jgi:hypothetical protein